MNIRKSILAILFMLPVLVSAQVEVNPSIQWRFVKSQTIFLGNGELYAFEFPAEADYDYILNLTHNTDSMYVTMGVYDMQNQALKRISNERTATASDLLFDVHAAGTYKIVLGVINPMSAKGSRNELTLSLVRRQKI